MPFTLEIYCLSLSNDVFSPISFILNCYTKEKRCDASILCPSRKTFTIFLSRILVPNIIKFVFFTLKGNLFVLRQSDIS